MDVAACENKAIGFLQEGDGSKSSTRLCLVLIVVFVLGFISALLWKIHGPITVAEFCNGVGALGTFVLSTGGVLYGANRLGECFDNRAPRGPQP